MAAPISEPRKLHLPDELVRALDEDDSARILEVLAKLTDAGIRLFLTELLRAVLAASRTGDLRDLQDTVEAWHRTLRLREDPQFVAGLDWAKTADRADAITVDDLRSQLGLPKPRTKSA